MMMLPLLIICLLTPHLQATNKALNQGTLQQTKIAIATSQLPVIITVAVMPNVHLPQFNYGTSIVNARVMALLFLFVLLLPILLCIFTNSARDSDSSSQYNMC